MQTPFTHTIAYAIRGLLESGVLLGNRRYIDAAIKAARTLADAQRADGWLAGTYDADLLKWTYSGDVGPASVETAEYRFIAKDAGMVAMVQWRSISAMLIYHEKSRIARQLQSTGP